MNRSARSIGTGQLPPQTRRLALLHSVKLPTVFDIAYRCLTGYAESFGPERLANSLQSACGRTGLPGVVVSYPSGTPAKPISRAS
jgi:hypothetical protein